MPCKHEIDDTKAEFVKGVGYRGPCIHCGKMVVHRMVMPPLSPAAEFRKRGNGKVHMSKKERLRLRREQEASSPKVNSEFPK